MRIISRLRNTERDQIRYNMHQLMIKILLIQFNNNQPNYKVIMMFKPNNLKKLLILLLLILSLSKSNRVRFKHINMKFTIKLILIRLSMHSYWNYRISCLWLNNQQILIKFRYSLIIINCLNSRHKFSLILNKSLLINNNYRPRIIRLIKFMLRKIKIIHNSLIIRIKLIIINNKSQMLISRLISYKLFWKPIMNLSVIFNNNQKIKLS